MSDRDPSSDPEFATLDGRALLQALASANVSYIVIGGLAVVAHGYQRSTRDIDIVPEPSSENLGRLVELLADLDYRVSGGEDFDENEILKPDLDGLKYGGNWVLATRLGRLDILQWVEPDMDYERLAANAIQDTAFGVPVRFCSLDDLLAMKEAAGRPQDLADIERLREIGGG